MEWSVNDEMFGVETNAAFESVSMVLQSVVAVDVVCQIVSIFYF